MTSVQGRVGCDTERTINANVMDGTFHNIGSALTVNPVIIIFDNQTDVDVPVSVDGVNIWKTFSAGSAMVLDLRSNKGLASDLTFDLGTQFSTNGASGTAGTFFRISIIYAK